MGLQLIFLVETNSKCKSDWIYIKETIDKFFSYDIAQVKLSVIYLNGKGNYNVKEKEINSLKSKYRFASKDNKSQVILCLDCDDYDSKPEDKDFLRNAELYCKNNGIDLVWFCKDIEQVYIGKKINDKDKKDEAAKFKIKKMIDNVDKKSLQMNLYRRNTSNIIEVIKKYLQEK